MARNREGESRRNSKEFTLFVQNFPGKTDSFALGKVFHRFGEVSDVYIPRKVDRFSGQRFAFVRFRNPNEAREAIKFLNGNLIFGKKILVKWAKFHKPSKLSKDQNFSPFTVGGKWSSRDDRSHGAARTKMAKKQSSCSNHTHRSTKRNPGVWVWRPKAVYSPGKGRASAPNEDRSVSVKEVHGSVCEENMNWLSKSLICISGNPLEPDSVEAFFQHHFPGLSRFSAMGNYKFLLSFESREVASRVLRESKDLFDNWFSEVRFWKTSDVCQTRRTWIELFGFPPHGWKPENIVKIAELWGEVVCMNEDTIDIKSLEAACVLIDTTRMGFINDSVNFLLDGESFVVKVLESRITVNSISPNGVGDSSDDNTVSVNHEGLVIQSKTHVDASNVVLEADPPFDAGQIQEVNLRGDDHSSSSRTWSDVLMGRNRQLASRHHHEEPNVMANQSGRALNEVQEDNVPKELENRSEDDSIAKEARETLEFSKIIGIRPEEGYEEAYLKRTEKNIRRIRREKASSKNRAGGI